VNTRIPTLHELLTPGRHRAHSVIADALAGRWPPTDVAPSEFSTAGAGARAGGTATSPSTVTELRLDAVEDRAATGGIAAALLSAGVACAAFGLAVVLSESIEALGEVLTLSDAVGPLSGKAVAAVVIYIVVWAALHLAWRRQAIELDGVFRWTCALVLVGLFTTFPPIYGLFAGH
jgi:hypothetical protein